MSSMKPEILDRPLRYGTVVGIGYTVDFAVFSIAFGLGQNVYLANILAFLVGATVNVILLRSCVFTSPRFGLLKDIGLTWMSNGLMFGFGMVLLWVLIELISINPFIAKIVSSGVTFLLNYLTRVRLFTEG